MRLRILSRSALPDGEGEVCFSCGERLLAYVPRCGHCGAQRAAAAHTEGRSRLEARPADVVRVAHLSDLHVGKADGELSSIDNVRMWLAALREAEADGVVISGDLVDSAGDEVGLKELRTLLDASGLWWATVPGNHDVKRPGEPGLYEREFGSCPRVVRKGGVALILADSNAGLAVGDRSAAERAFAIPWCYTEGAIGVGQLGALERQLDGAVDKVRILVMHHHLVHQHATRVLSWLPIEDQAAGMMKVLRDADLVHQWCIRQGVKVVLHGHQHRFLRAGVQREGLVVLNGGRSTEAPYRARLLDIGPTGAVYIVEVALSI